ncbi:MAG: PIN domain-containing protein [Desulfurococcales archaeon]
MGEAGDPEPRANPANGIKDIHTQVFRSIVSGETLEAHYLEVALLEAMWKVLKIVGREKLERVKIGLEAIRKSYRVAEPPPEAYIEAIKIYDKEHRDYIDALHYATAKALGILFSNDRLLVHRVLEEQ